MKRLPKLSTALLQNTLINTRQMTSLIERDLALATTDVKRETVNWVPMWVDWNHTVRSDCNTATAMRAISDRGELLWYVRHDTKKHGYHALHHDPFDAIAEAMEAWRKRRLVRKQWADVRRLSQDLLMGRKKLTVTLEDAEESALCTLGIKWFRETLHISHKTTLSGRTAAALMKVEPQMGFVIYEAAQREGIWTAGPSTTTEQAPAAAYPQTD